jgi:ABC-type siderophore export system fused ATPase/permease subunit
MKKFFNSINLEMIILYFLVALFTFGLFLALWEALPILAFERLTAVFLTISLILKTKTIKNYVNVVNSFQLLVGTHEKLQNHKSEIINGLKDILLAKNQRLELLEHIIDEHSIIQEEDDVKKSK